MNAIADQPAANPFWFSEYLLMPRPTGQKATNLRELLKYLQEMAEPVLQYHLWEYRLPGHPAVLEYPNDFALWAAHSLHDGRLAEKLSCIDPFAYDNLTQIREALVDLLADYLQAFPHNPQVHPGFEFFFCEASAVVMRSGIAAQTLRQFSDALQALGLDSVYYHFVEARWRLGDPKKDDFSHWIDTNYALPGLVAEIRNIDVYFYTPNEIRDAILAMIERHVGESLGQPE